MSLNKLFGFDKAMANRQERRLTKIQARTERVAIRQNTKATAYSNGIDPEESKWAGIASITQSAAGAASAILPGRGRANINAGAGGFSASFPTGDGENSSSSMLLIGLGVIVLLFMSNKSR